MKTRSHIIQCDTHTRSFPFSDLRTTGSEQSRHVVPPYVRPNRILEDCLQCFAVSALHMRLVSSPDIKLYHRIRRGQFDVALEIKGRPGGPRLTCLYTS